ncbi:MAG: MBL fold metallo-hydrolase [Planctomycetaceae bacterium]|nr:MBL fold metallo-hydrolase [Planctomycetaceae bacterium]
MRPRMTVLGSGSSGNATLLQYDDANLLIDAGLGPRQIQNRIRDIGCGWADLDGVLLTHTHGDHWRENTLAKLARFEIPFYCHPRHATDLRNRSDAFRQIEESGLVRKYRAGERNRLPFDGQMTPFEVSHDSGPTLGFRIEREGSLFSPGWAVAYAADLGTWTEDLLPYLVDADLLALEFNHDVPMQRVSRRPPFLIERVLGDKGHLSNGQACELLSAVIRASASGRLKKLVQLHLSRECNTPRLAQREAKSKLTELNQRVEVATAAPHQPTAITGWA